MFVNFILMNDLNNHILNNHVSCSYVNITADVEKEEVKNMTSQLHQPHIIHKCMNVNVETMK